MNKNTLFIIIAIVVVGAILYYISTRPHDNPNGLTDSNGVTGVPNGRGGYMANGREAIKCCTARDSNCHCTSFVWRASSDCSTVGCGGSGNNRLAPKCCIQQDSLGNCTKWVWAGANGCSSDALIGVTTLNGTNYYNPMPTGVVGAK